MSNPYEATLRGDQLELNKPLPPPQPPGMVGHVRVVAILMGIQGILEILMAIYYGVFGMFFGPAFTKAMMSDPNMQRGGGTPPEVMSMIMTVAWIVMAACGLIPGLLHCYAGYRSFLFQSRTLGIIALVGGLLSLGTVYCCPTSTMLLIYGLIVYMNSQVGQAYEMTMEGYPPNAILATFSRFRYEQKQTGG